LVINLGDRVSGRSALTPRQIPVIQFAPGASGHLNRVDLNVDGTPACVSSGSAIFEEPVRRNGGGRDHTDARSSWSPSARRIQDA
jgi:hypothetical protein